jgi:hypothetical protein
MKQINKFFILFLIIILLSQNVLAQTTSIPWDEVRALYGDTVAQNARRMVEEQGISPLLIRELDKWTGAIHFEYKLPSNIPTGNVNIWVYDPTTNTVTWSGPGPAPYSPEEALQKIQQYNSSGPQNPFTPQPSGTTQQISLLANNQTNLTVYVGDTINYTWSAPSGSGYTYSSTYTADAPDNCPGGIMQQGETKPWVANTQQGSTSAVVQQCQAGRTYTITYMVKNSAGTTIHQTSITIRVSTGRRPSTAGSPQLRLTPNPLDVSFYRGPTTIPGVTDNQMRSRATTQIQNTLDTNSFIDLLSDVTRKINTILDNAQNLNQQDRSAVIRDLQAVLQALQELVTNLTTRVSRTPNQNINPSNPPFSNIEYREVVLPNINKEELIKLAQEKTYEEMINLFGNDIEKIFVDKIKPEDIPSNFKKDSFFAYFLGLNKNPQEGEISGRFVFHQGEWLIAPTGNISNQLQNFGNNVVGLWVEDEFFDLKTEDTVSTRVRVWYSKDTQNFDQDSNVSISIDDNRIAKVEVDKIGGTITITGLNPGQTTVNVHPALINDSSKDKKIKIRVFDKNVKINSFVLSDDIINLYANTSQKISGLVYLSDGSISPAFKVFSDKPDLVGVDIDSNGVITISASMSLDTYNLSYQSAGDYSSPTYQSYTATLIIRPLFAGDDKSFDKIVTVNVEPPPDYLLPFPVSEPKLPLYIFELSSNRKISELSPAQIDELNTYFSNNVGVMPSYFLPDSWMAWQLNLGEEIPTSYNGLPLQAILFGYQYQDGKYVNVFSVPNFNAVGLKIKDSAGVVDHIISVYDTISKTSSYAIGAEFLINRVGTKLGLSALQSISYKAFQYTSRFSAAIAPVGLVITGVELVNWLNNHRRTQHYKEDDTKIANDMMAKIKLVVDTYNNNRAPDAEQERKYHDAMVLTVNNIFYASAPYFKLQRSLDSQKAYLDSFIKMMDETLNRRLASF